MDEVQTEVVAEVVDQVQEAQTEEVTTDGVQEEGQEAAQEVKPEKKDEPLPKGVQKRIDRAVRQKYEAEARMRVLEERLANMDRQPQQQQKIEGEPRLEQYDNLEDYVTAKARWVAKSEMSETLTARERAQAEQSAKAAQSKSVELWERRKALATAEMPDWEEVVDASDVTFKDPVAVHTAIMESDLGPQIAYYLASNPDEADLIADLTGAAAIRAIGRIEAKIEFKKVAVTKTPAPIKPVGQKAQATKSPDKMTSDEFAKWRKEFIKRR